MALVSVSVIFGGGGSAAGMMNLVVQLCALALLAVNGEACLDFVKSAPRLLVILMGVTLAWPLLQVVPLPPSVWHGLPGRDLVQASLAFVGQENAWFPVSVNPGRTWIAFFSLVPPFALLVLSWRLDGEERRKVILLLLTISVVFVLFGAQQLGMGNRKMVFYDDIQGSSVLHATFANRNSAGIYLAVSLSMLVGIWRGDGRDMKWLFVGLGAAGLIVAGDILTRSRTGVAALLLPAALAGFRFVLPALMKGRRRRMQIWVGLGGFVVLAGIAGGVAFRNDRIHETFSRYETVEEDRRPMIWEDSLQAIHRFWPVGSGVGTFDDVFQVDETLENLAPGRAGRAHNDYLEVTLESGVVGIALLVCWAGVLAYLGAHFRRLGGLGQGALVGLLILVLQSVVDYPLRSQTLLCVAAVLFAVTIGALPGRRDISSRSKIGSDPEFDREQGQLGLH